MSPGLSRESARLGEAVSDSCRQESDEKPWKSCIETSRSAGLQGPLSVLRAGQAEPIVGVQPRAVGDGLGKCFTFLSLLPSGAKRADSPLLC